MAFTHRKIRPYIIVMKSGNHIEDYGMEILNVSTSSQLSEEPGTFSFSVLPRSEVGGGIGKSTQIPQLYNVLSPGDLVSIGFEKVHGTMLGRISRVEKSKTSVGGKLTKSLNISGQCIGNDLVQDNFRNIPSKNGTDVLELSENQQASTKELEKFEKITFSEFIQNALKRLPSLNIELNLMGTPTTLGELIKIQSTIPVLKGDEVLNPKPNNSNGNFTEYIWNAIDKEYYEMFWDTTCNESGNPFVKLIIRPKPLDRQNDIMFDPVDEIEKPLINLSSYQNEKSFVWENLRLRNNPEQEYHTITEDQIFEIQLGVSSDKVYTAYTVKARQNSSDENQDNVIGSQSPILNVGLQKQFGYRELMIPSAQIPTKLEQIETETGGMLDSSKTAFDIQSKIGNSKFGKKLSNIAQNVSVVVSNVQDNVENVITSANQVVSQASQKAAEISTIAKDSFLNNLESASSLVESQISKISEVSENFTTSIASLQEQLDNTKSKISETINDEFSTITITLKEVTNSILSNHKESKKKIVEYMNGLPQEIVLYAEGLSKTTDSIHKKFVFPKVTLLLEEIKSELNRFVTIDSSKLLNYLNTLEESFNQYVNSIFSNLNYTDEEVLKPKANKILLELKRIAFSINKELLTHEESLLVRLNRLLDNIRTSGITEVHKRIIIIIEDNFKVLDTFFKDSSKSVLNSIKEKSDLEDNRIITLLSTLNNLHDQKFESILSRNNFKSENEINTVIEGISDYLTQTLSSLLADKIEQELIDEIILNETTFFKKQVNNIKQSAIVALNEIRNVYEQYLKDSSNIIAAELQSEAKIPDGKDVEFKQYIKETVDTITNSIDSFYSNSSLKDQASLLTIVNTIIKIQTTTSKISIDNNFNENNSKNINRIYNFENCLSFVFNHSNILTELKEDFSALVSETLSNGNLFVDKMLSEIEDGLLTGKNIDNKEIKKILEDFDEEFKTYKNSISSNIAKAKFSFSTSVNNVSNLIKKEEETFQTTISQIVPDVSTGEIENAIKSSINSVKNEISSSLDNISSSFKNAIQNSPFSSLTTRATEKSNKLLENQKQAKNNAFSKQRRLYNWNKLNLFFESGKITFLGRESVKVGEKIFLPDEIAKDGSKGLEGYITEVSHRWGFGGKYETSISVERCITQETLQKFNQQEKTITV